MKIRPFLFIPAVICLWEIATSGEIMETTFIMGKTLTPISYTDTAAQSIAVPNDCTKVRIYTSTNAFYLIGSNPTATSSNGSVPTTGGIWEYIDISPGQKISFIRDTVSGTAYVTPVRKVE